MTNKRKKINDFMTASGILVFIFSFTVLCLSVYELFFPMIDCYDRLTPLGVVVGAICVAVFGVLAGVYLMMRKGGR